MAAAERRAAVVWEGNLPKGNGTLELASGAAGELPVTWSSRTQRSEGKTSPEELIAGAHATCYAMQFANELSEAGHDPDELTVGATCTLDDSDGHKITTIALTVMGRVSDLDEDEFRKIADSAKEHCPVSVALSGNVEISLDAKLESQ